ncbi:hypothetical protein N9D23_15850, partial [Rubripirellula sp.]|nr:hypothetical protein [Rubripirellula sp.]
MSIQNLTSHSNQANRNECQSAVIAVAAADSSRPLYGWIAWFTVLVVVSLMATRATGQVAKTPFESIPMHPALQDEKKVKQVEALTKQFANTGQGNAASVNGYFAFYLPAKMTAPDGVKHISDLMSDATGLLGRAERSNNPQVLQVVRRYIFDGMKKVAEGNFHPAARINAILMLSRLNIQPANLQNKTAPVPLAEALPILMQMYQNEQNVDGVRAAALQGIRRQTMYGFPQISQQNRQAISQIAKDLLDSAPPAGRSQKAHAFLQRSAVDILDVLKPQDDKQFATKLVSLSTESSQPDLIALYAAQRLGAMAADLQGQVDKPEDLVQSWTKRILHAYENDLKRINALERPMTNVSQPPKPETFLQTRAQESPTNTGDAGMRMDMDETEMSGMEMNMMEDREESGDDMEGMEGMMGGMMGGM